MSELELDFIDLTQTDPADASVFDSNGEQMLADDTNLIQSRTSEAINECVN
jgi:hypothetical protein